MELGKLLGLTAADQNNDISTANMFRRAQD
jgi:hypothetical protein